MKPNLTTLEGNLAACNRADDLYVRMKENGKCEVTPREILMLPCIETEMHFRSLLKTKGMPMSGHIFPQLDPRYEYQRGYNFENGNDVFYWRRILEPPTKTEIHCREHKQARFEKMLEWVYGFFRRKI